MESVSVVKVTLLGCLLSVCLLALPGLSQSTGAAQAINTAKAVDLTYSFDKDTIYWPTSPGFQWQKTQWGKTPAGYWYTSANYGANEHGGTHLDSPLHFHEGGAATD